MKKPSLLLALVGLMFASLTPASAAERVRVTTNFGAFVIELQRDRAPLTVENFLGYVRSGYYTNTLFHRTIANFVVQGGGVGTDYKAKPVGKPIANESGNGLKNLRGTVGLARAAGPHSGDCQFYINVADNALSDELDAVCAENGFSRLEELSSEELSQLEQRLTAFERRVSDDRRDRYDRLDALSAELVRRYRSEFAAYCAELETMCSSRRIEYLRTTTAMPFEEFVLQILRRVSSVA